MGMCTYIRPTGNADKIMECDVKNMQAMFILCSIYMIILTFTFIYILDR